MLNVDIEMFLTLDKYRILDELIYTSNVFAVVEAAKHRRRAILEPLINDLISKSDLLSVPLVSKQYIRWMASFQYVASFDASAFFDQFRLPTAVSKFFGFQHGEKTLAQTTLPMGFRPSVDIAQATALAILDFKHIGNTVSAAYVDNFFFASSSKEDLLASIRIFIERCAHVGLVLNESEARIIENEPFEWLGERYEPGRLRTLTDNTRTKLDAAHLLIKRWQRQPISRRQAAAIFGLFFFASPIVELGLADFFNAQRLYRDISRDGQIHGWRQLIGTPTAVAISEMLLWLSRIRSAKPVPVCGTQEPDTFCLTAYVDASAWGWGATVTDAVGTVRNFSCPWSPADKAHYNVSSSTCAEPLAMQKLLAILLSTTGKWTSLLIYTDHKPLMFAVSARTGKTWMYNRTAQVVERFREYFGVDIVVRWIAGTENLADALSRGGVRGTGVAGFFSLSSVRVGSVPLRG